MKIRQIVGSVIVVLELFCVFANAQKLPVGYPERTGKINLEENFERPPKGYGEVPFYWWVGDTLTRDRIEWHLDMLKNKGISSLQINYAHDDKGGITYGQTLSSKPALFSEEWWELFGWFMKEARKRNMTVSLSDYTLGVGQGSYVDEMLAEDSSLTGSELRFRRDTLTNGTFSRIYEELPLSLHAYQLAPDGSVIGKKTDLLPLVKDGTISWKTDRSLTIVTEVRAERKIPSLDPMHSNVGKSYVKHFFQRFEDRFPEEAKEGLNFFFSDELSFNLQGFLWNDIFREEFRARKGYDLVPFIDALFMDVGDMTPAIRLDYNDVYVSLSEENFFRPLYNWHSERGLLFGCDHGGRGRDVVEFGDYFRTQRWNQAPGCDQPYLQTDIIKNKVATSIAHMYNRERVWLEGFHSSGWSTNSEQLTHAIFSNMAMGHSILSLHGLYYSTVGGWWEWAPPCNHFHEPYWIEMEPLLKCTERLSYILSQGYHRADVAVLYPVEPVIAGYGDKAVQTAFAAGELLYKSGLDFDFMDYESLARAEVHSGKLSVSNEHFRVLIIPSMKAIRHASLEKILEFRRKGGIVIHIGDIPEATEKGRNHQTVKKLLSQIYDKGANPVYCIDNLSALPSIIDSRLTRDFRVLSGENADRIPYVMHRTISNREMYAVYNVEKGAECFFRAKGAATLWNPWTGERTPLPVERVLEEGSVVRIPLHHSDMHIITFDSSEEPVVMDKKETESATIHKIMDREWRFELAPQLDNRYGDFSLPAYDDKVGALIYAARYTAHHDSAKERMLTFTQGSKFMLLGAAPEINAETLLANLSDHSKAILVDGVRYEWQPYDFSWRWGVDNDYGRQGWHGLKAQMYDDFIRLGRTERTSNSNEVLRKQETNGHQNYYLYSRVMAPRDGVYEVEYGAMMPAALYINGGKVEPADGLRLKKGINEMLLHYNSYGVTRFALRDGAPRVMKEVQGEMPLRMKFRGDRSVLLFDVCHEAGLSGSYRFVSAPGLEGLEFHSFGECTVTCDGMQAKMKVLRQREDGLISYKAVFPQRILRPAEVTIEIAEVWGYTGGSAIDGPIRQLCGEGLIPIGDWSGIEGLKAYSGGAWYRTEVNFDSLDGKSVYLDLRRVISTARVKVNGHDAGMRLSSPWKFDLTRHLQKGKNLIEVFVCNTAANYYLSVPTLYRGSIEAGILSPVVIETVVTK